MLKRIAAIALILCGTSIAWLILANSIWSRTTESDDKLKPSVSSTWGSPQIQVQPFVTLEEAKLPTPAMRLDAESSRVDANLTLEYRRKGLLWYSVYVVDFSGSYLFRNPTSQPQKGTFQLYFPSRQAIYDGLTIDVEGKPQPFESNSEGASVSVLLEAGQTVNFRAAYRSQGLESWRYKLGENVTQTRDFQLTAKTNYADIDFPTGTLSPTSKRYSAPGWELTWKYRNLISGFQIGMTMPEKLQPGPLAADICRFAPVSLLLFFFVMFILTTLRRIDLHPMNYFFLAAAFFSFHLLLAYLADHLSIGVSFFICSAVSVALVVSYLRLVVGARSAIIEAGIAQFVYLVLFSYSFFLNGFTGLAITIGCIATLFVTMQLTGHIRWSTQFSDLIAADPAAAKQEH